MPPTSNKLTSLHRRYLSSNLLAVSRLASSPTLTPVDYACLLNLRRKYVVQFLYAFGLTFISTNTGQGTQRFLHAEMLVIHLYNTTTSVVSRIKLKVSSTHLSVHRPEFQITRKRFGNWICFNLKVRGMIPSLLGPLKRAEFI
jgi:hypothetical protein